MRLGIHLKGRENSLQLSRNVLGDMKSCNFIEMEASNCFHAKRTLGAHMIIRRDQ